MSPRRRSADFTRRCANGTCDHEADLFFEAMTQLMGQEGIERFIRFLKEVAKQQSRKPSRRLSGPKRANGEDR